MKIVFYLAAKKQFTKMETVYVISVWDCRRNPDDFKQVIDEIIF